MGRTQDFSNSVIYHIRHMESKNIIYVGSTTQFPQRKNKHKYRCNTEKDKNWNLAVYQYIRECGGLHNFEIIPVNYLKLENKTQLIIEEQKEIDKHPNVKNLYRPYVTDDQRINQKKEYWKKYYEDNKEEINERKRNSVNEKEYHKLYYQSHKEQRKQWIEKNKDITKEKYKRNQEHLYEKLECPICNSIITRQHIKRHQKSKKCMEFPTPPE